MPMTDPYANVQAPMAAKAPKTPPKGVMPRTPQELDAMLSQGFTMNDDGSLAPPALPMPPPNFSASPTPRAGMTPRMMPEDAYLPPSEPEAFLSDPIFGAHMAIRNPKPERMGPLERMMAPAEEPPPPVNVSVPGGASIVDGQPRSAKTPTPTYKPTYNVTMPTSEEASQRQYQTEVQRGQNHQNKRDYEEMLHRRKVSNLRGILGRG